MSNIIQTTLVAYLIINPDLMVKNNSQNAGIESKNFKVREAKS